jgi:hypothetical protein
MAPPGFPAAPPPGLPAGFAMPPKPKMPGQ